MIHILQLMGAFVLDSCVGFFDWLGLPRVTGVAKVWLYV